jgi:hypothetical protein
MYGLRFAKQLAHETRVSGIERPVIGKGKQGNQCGRGETILTWAVIFGE